MVESVDWSKAKNILIIAFIITNIFLIYSIEKDMFDKDSLEARSERKIKEVVDILEKRSIRVEADIPIEVMALPILDVEYTTYEIGEVQELFSSQGKITLLNNDKVLHYKRDIFSRNNINFTEEEANQEAEEFLKKYRFKSKDVVFWSSKPLGNQYKILFKQEYKGRILEDSYMSLIVTNEGVAEFERMWLKPLKLGTNKMEVMPSSKGLLKFMEDDVSDEEEIVITKVDLVYWLDISQNSFTNWESVESGTAIPAWRIELENGEVSFIPGFEDY